MASNEQTYHQAMTKWEALHDSESLSVPPNHGTMALLLPFNHAGRDNEDLPGQNFNDLQAATYKLAERAIAEGHTVEVAINANVIDFDRVLTDPAISDVVVVGHGCLSSVEIDSQPNANRIDWMDIAYYSDHLKAGRFVQMTCGTLPRQFNVPLGLFAVSEHSRVWAATGLRIVPADFWSVNNYIAPVTDEPSLSYGQIKELFPQRTLTVTSEARIVLEGLKGALVEHLSSMEPSDMTDQA